MLSDRTYLLFKPRSNLPNDRLNIRQDNSSSSYGLSSTSPSSYRGNQLSHSSSYERLASKAFSGGSTPLTKRKFGPTSGLSTNTSINHSIYDNNYDNLYGGYAPRRRTATFSHNSGGGSPSYNSGGSYNSNYNTNSYNSNSYNSGYDRRPALQKSDSFGSSMALYPEKSSNMEKREMLMSSFNRHTNAPATNSGQNWFNRLKLNLFNSSPSQPKSILPPRPSSAFYNYGKSNYVSPYRMSTYRVNYLTYDDYYRPRIRDRPLFSDIRKSVMHKVQGPFKNNRAYYANGGYSNGNYQNKFNKSAGAKSNASILSNGSSGGLSSSSSGGSINYTQQSTSPSETPAYSSPAQSQKLESQKSIRKVDRYRSVIKFREHNIGKTYEERKQQINWDINSEDVLNELVGGALNKCEPALDTSNLVDWNVITDTTILTHSSSTTTLSDLNVGYEPVTDEVSSKLEQQFAEIKRKNEELEKLKSALEDDSLLSSGRRKLHKSVNIRQANGTLAVEAGKKSKSVKINANAMVKNIKADDLVEQIKEVNEKFNRFEAKVAKTENKDEKAIDKTEKLVDQTEKLDKAETDEKKQGKTTKKILKTAKSLSKKPSKVMIREESKESLPESPTTKTPIKVLNKGDEKFKNKQQAFKTLFVKEMHTVTCHQPCKKTEYFRLPVQSVRAMSPPIKTPFCRLECTIKTSPLVRTEFERPKILVAKAVAGLVKTAYSSPQILTTKLSLPSTKTAYSSPQLVVVKLISPPIKTAYSSPKLTVVKLSSPPVKTAFSRPVVYFVEAKSDPVRTDYQKPVLHKTSTRLSNFKCSYRRPELAIVQTKSPLLKTDFHRLKLEQAQLLLPPAKTKYERLELQVTKPVRSGLVKTEFESPKMLTVQLKTKPIRTDFTRFPVQTTVKILGPQKTDYFKVPVQIIELKLGAQKGEYQKVPVQIVRLKIDCFASPEYQSPKAEQPPVSPKPVSKQPSFSQTSLNQTSAKPPLNPSVKSQLNRSSKKSTLNQLDEQKDTKVPSKAESVIGSALSSIKSALSLNHDANQAEDAEKKPKKKVKKAKAPKKASSISGANNENRVPEIVQQTMDFDDESNEQMNDYYGERELADANYQRLAVNEDKRKLLTRSVSVDYEQNGSNVNTFQNAMASREQYRLPQRKRIKFRNYNLEDFHLQSVLGRGSFGKVFLAELIGHEVYFAIKCLKKNVVIEDNDVESTMIERKVLALGSSNPFICKLFCTFQSPSYLCFAMEYLAGGDLMFHVQKCGRFEEDRARFYAAEIVCALKFLHRRYIIYRDLKLDNILLDQGGHIRLVDFGMCQLKIYRQECLPSNFCGTPDYMAPEIVKGVKYNNSVDWWSFGVLLYEMLIGKSPFTGADEDELLWNVCNERIVFPLFLSKEAVHIIALLLNRNPDKRLGMPGCPAGDVTQQQFFANTNWQMADAKLLPPPFIPDLNGANDIQNFDKEFTEAEPALTPVEESIVSELNHDLFQGFDYCNPNMTD